jgi:transcriptional regulator with XRE-family HTH domain
MTGRGLAAALGVAEPTVWRWLRGEGLTLERLDEICGILGLDLRDLALATPESGATRFTLAQERVLAADRPLAFLFFLILNDGDPETFGRDFRLSAEQVEDHLHTLTRLGLVDRRGGRVRALTTRSVAWRPGGPLAMAFEKTVKHLFLGQDFGSPAATYVADMVRLSQAGRAKLHGLFTALRLEVHKLAEEDRQARHETYEWSAVLMLVRALDMDEVAAAPRRA